jgi:hypothetical protein
MIVVGYKPWLVRHLGVAFVSLILVIIGQHEALTYTRAERAPIFAHHHVPVLSGAQLGDVRLANPGGGATGREPPNTPTVPMASGAQGGGDGDRWTAIL